MRLSVCRAARVVAVWIVLGWSTPALAQGPPTVGERYNVELAGVLWGADPSAVIKSESIGIPGTEIDLVDDLGIEEKRLRELRVVLRPAPKHKFRINYLPIQYQAETVVQREFVFNGQLYRVGIPVNTDARFNQFRFGYEYDFFYRPRGYVGVMVDLKYTDVAIDIASAAGPEEFTELVAPIPGIGFTGRGYVAPNTSITGEVTFFKIPEGLGGEEYGGSYVEWDFYGTFNFNDHVGAQLGLRSIDVDYFKDLDSGNLNFRGWYFGGVVRF